MESGLFNRMKEKTTSKGDFRLILNNNKHFKKYISICVMGFPGWFMNGVVMTFSPEIGRAWGMNPLPSVSAVFTFFFIGFTFGDLSSGFVSQLMRSRKKAILLYLSMFGIGMAAFFMFAKYSLTLYYGIFLFLGFSAGYTIVLLTLAAEQFGTNIRATVTTSALNLIRATVIPQATLFGILSPIIGAAHSALVVGVIAICLAFWALGNLEETFDKDLDFTE
jgi:MFS transporter, putative metabolite:H+ symporter